MTKRRYPGLLFGHNPPYLSGEPMFLTIAIILAVVIVAHDPLSRWVRRSEPSSEGSAPKSYMLEDVTQNRSQWYCLACDRYIQRLFKRDEDGKLRFVGMFCVTCGQEHVWRRRKKRLKLALRCSGKRDFFTLIRKIEREVAARVPSEDALAAQIANLEKELAESQSRLAEIEISRVVNGAQQKIAAPSTSVETAVAYDRLKVRH